MQEQVIPPIIFLVPAWVIVFHNEAWSTLLRTVHSCHRPLSAHTCWRRLSWWTMRAREVCTHARTHARTHTHTDTFTHTHNAFSASCLRLSLFFFESYCMILLGLCVCVCVAVFVHVCVSVSALVPNSQSAYTVYAVWATLSCAMLIIPVWGRLGL